MKAALVKAPVPESAKGPTGELKRSTRVGEVYWCNFCPHSWIPEFDDKHLVVIVKSGKKEKDIHLVVPLTKRPQEGPHGYRLIENPNPGSADESWAVCDHIYAVASERLEFLRHKGSPRIPEKLAERDLTEISRRVRQVMSPFLRIGLAEPAQPEQKTEPEPEQQGEQGTAIEAKLES